MQEFFFLISPPTAEHFYFLSLQGGQGGHCVQGGQGGQDGQDGQRRVKVL